MDIKGKIIIMLVVLLGFVTGYAAVTIFGEDEVITGDIPVFIECQAPDVYITTNSSTPEVAVYVDEAAFVSSYTDLEYLLDSDIRRFVGESDKRGWGINKIDITHLGNGVWEGKVTYNTLPTKYVEIFTFNEGFGWHING